MTASARASISNLKLTFLLPQPSDSEGEEDPFDKEDFGEIASDAALDELFLDLYSNRHPSTIDFYRQESLREQKPWQQGNSTVSPPFAHKDVQFKTKPQEKIHQQQLMPLPATVSPDTVSIKERSPSSLIRGETPFCQSLPERTVPVSDSEESLSQKRPRSYELNSDISSQTTSVSGDIVGRDHKRLKKVDHNLREKQRCHRITDQIDQTRHILSQRAGIDFCKTDRLSVLTTINEYIQQSQTRLANLENEHEQIVNKIKQTSELSEPIIDPSPSKCIQLHGPPTKVTIRKEILPSFSRPNSRDFKIIGWKHSADDINDLNFKTIFLKSSVAVAIVALDGHFLDCNNNFETLSGYNQKELTRNMTLFTFLPTKELGADVRTVMYSLIQNKGREHVYSNQSFWNGVIVSKRHPDWILTMTITLETSSIDRNPMFFTCTLSKQ